MPKYQLEIRQCEIYPRCRISQGFFQSLIDNRDIRTNGCPGLFSYVTLCSLASFRPMHLRLERISYAIQPGEWVCALDELKGILRLRTESKVLEILWVMQNRGLIQYTLLDRGRRVRFKILDWHTANRVMQDNCLNTNQDDFFLLPAATAVDLIGSVKCSEMDVILDILLSAVYKDGRIKGSYTALIVYFRNEDSNVLITYDELSKCWGLSRRDVRRVLKKFTEIGYIRIQSVSWRSEIVIYLAGELRTAFQVSDIMLDKDELPAQVRVDISMDENNLTELRDTMIDSVYQYLSRQGITCPQCNECTHDFRPLPEYENTYVEEEPTVFHMDVFCGWDTRVGSFDLYLCPDKG